METVRFDELDLMPQIQRAVKEMGFEEANRIICFTKRLTDLEE